MIRKSKILFITNSNAAVATLSTESVDLYKSLRGIDSTHIISYDFGTASPWNIGGDTGFNSLRTGFLTTVSDYIYNNNIEAVICALGVPYTIFNSDATYQVSPYIDERTNGVSGMFAHAYKRVLNGWGQYFTGSAATFEESTYTDGTVGTIEFTKIIAIQPFLLTLEQYRSSVTTGAINVRLPHGKLGVPQATLSSESLVRLESIVTRCIAAEKSQDHYVVGGLHDRLLPELSAIEVKTALDWASEIVQTNKIYHWKRTYSASYPEPLGTNIGTHTAIEAGTNRPVVSANLFFGTALANTSSPWYNSFNFLPGSIVAESTSFDTAAINAARNSNLDCGIGTVCEPLSGGAISIDAVSSMLFYGYSVMMAAMWNRQDMVECFGDPLYAPFGWRAMSPETFRYNWIEK